MGYTFRPEEGRGGDAMEGKFCDGRTDAFRDSAQGRGKHGLVVPRVWNFTQDRIQDPGPLRAVRGGGVKAIAPVGRIGMPTNCPPQSKPPSWPPNEKSPTGEHARSTNACCDGYLQK